MEHLLAQERFNFVTQADKAFILAFDQAMSALGYGCGGTIGSGYCWGKYMIIYAKGGVKGQSVAARIYIREQGIVLRLFLSGIQRHREFLENAPEHIREVFLEGHGDCRRCHNEKNGACRFRKSYVLEGRQIQKCNGFTFEFSRPNLDKLPDYADLLNEFFRPRRPPRIPLPSLPTGKDQGRDHR